MPGSKSSSPTIARDSDGIDDIEHPHKLNNSAALNRAASWRLRLISSRKAVRGGRRGRLTPDSILALYTRRGFGTCSRAHNLATATLNIPSSSAISEVGFPKPVQRLLLQRVVVGPWISLLAATSQHHLMAQNTSYDVVNSAKLDDLST
jgi:hypothetical protein